MRLKIRTQSYSSMLFFLLFFVLFSCGDNKPVIKSQEPADNLQIDSLKQAIVKLKPGRYGDLSVAVDTLNNVTGVYEFYNAWDEQYKEYMQVNVFYFAGVLKGNIVDIKTAWPTSEQRLSGKLLISNDSVRLSLNEMPDGYASVDFVKGFSNKISEPKYWKQIRIVKLPKVRLFNSPDSSQPRKGYLIANDVVKVLSVENKNWLKIEFSSKGDTKNLIYGWIQEDALYGIDPENWQSNQN